MLRIMFQYYQSGILYRAFQSASVQVFAICYCNSSDDFSRKNRTMIFSIGCHAAVVALLFAAFYNV